MFKYREQQKIENIIFDFQRSLAVAEKNRGVALGDYYFVNYIAAFLAHDVPPGKRGFFLADLVEYTKRNMATDVKPEN